MSKLALSDEILMTVEKPARYIGNEVNAIIKDKEKVDVRFCMCFPDVYEIGMSHLGIQILYDMFNRYEDTWCERVYSPWVDIALSNPPYDNDSDPILGEIGLREIGKSWAGELDTHDYRVSPLWRQY